MNRLLSLRRVLDQVDVSRGYLYELLTAGKFPPPIKVGRQNRWSEQAVQQWIADRVAGVPLEPVYQDHERRTA